MKINPQRNSNISVPNVCALKKNFSQLINDNFGHVSITRLILLAIEGFMESFPGNVPDLE